MVSRIIQTLQETVRGPLVCDKILVVDKKYMIEEWDGSHNEIQVLEIDQEKGTIKIGYLDDMTWVESRYNEVASRVIEIQ